MVQIGDHFFRKVIHRFSTSPPAGLFDELLPESAPFSKIFSNKNLVGLAPIKPNRKFEKVIHHIEENGWPHYLQVPHSNESQEKFIHDVDIELAGEVKHLAVEKQFQKIH